jgi:hypothetical protein
MTDTQSLEGDIQQQSKFDCTYFRPDDDGCAITSLAQMWNQSFTSIRSLYKSNWIYALKSPT